MVSRCHSPTGPRCPGARRAERVGSRLSARLIRSRHPFAIAPASRAARSTTAYERGWSRLKNGELLDMAEKEGFAVLVTTDSNMKYQQNLKFRRIAIVALTTPSWPRIQRAIGAVARAVDGASEGSYSEVSIP